MGLIADPIRAFYSATKFALEAYSESLWYELKPFGIGVSLIEPGYIRTSISHAARIAAGLLPAYEGPRNRVTAAIKSGVEKGCSPELVAKAVLLAADQPQSPPAISRRLRFPWLPRLRKAVPWSFFAFGLRRQFALDPKV